ncbi:hypothetical protein BGZ94_003727 [Podila epigama]|nr:hypothetical protein BGZ94_003727 [Podila epigama]
MTKSRKKQSAKESIISHPTTITNDENDSRSVITNSTTTTTTTTTTRTVVKSTLEEEPSLAMTSSTSLSSLKHSSSVTTLLDEGLEDLDGNLSERLLEAAGNDHCTSAQPNRPPKTKENEKTQNDVQTLLPLIENTSTWWGWFTAPRIVSDIQLNDELNEERARHRARRSSSNQDKDYTLLYDLDDAEVEKKHARFSWDVAKAYKAYDLSGKDYLALGTLAVFSLGIRMWHLNKPDQVILGEGHIVNHVNSYLKNEFNFDVHPPLGRLLMTQLAKDAGYDGSTAFDSIGSSFPSSLPYVTMRSVSAAMGALVAPMAFLTLKAGGQSAPTAMIASLLVILDNALTAQTRTIALDSPLLFFSAMTVMSWSMFSKNSPRPFSLGWWSWLLLTGIAAAGAMSTKLSGFFSAILVLALATRDMWRLTLDDSVNGVRWVQHLFARTIMLLILPVTIYLALFHLHFSLQTNQPDVLNSVHGAYDMNLLSLSYRNSLVMEAEAQKTNTIWSDIAYGSIIQLTSEFSPNVNLHSMNEILSYPHSSKQQAISGYAHSDLNTYWLLTRAETTADEPYEVPSRLQYLKNGDMIRLRHLTSRRCLHSHDVRPHCCVREKRYCEVSAYGAGANGDPNDNWVVEVVTSDRANVLPTSEDVPVKALETTIRLRHSQQNCFLFYDGGILAPDSEWGLGRREITCLKEAKASSVKSMWRITRNTHDFRTEAASYPQLSFWAKLKETHTLMRTRPRAVEANDSPAAGPSSNPMLWPLAQAVALAWVAEHGQQIVVVPNNAVWWIGTLGIAVFLFASVLFLAREQRGYFETGLASAIKHFHLPSASVFFAAWAIHYLPYFLIQQSRAHAIHQYFPSLYFSILVACTVFSGITAYLPKGFRLALHVGVLALVAGIFIQFAPLTFGSPMEAGQCQVLEQKLSSVVKLGRRPDAPAFLDCSAFSPSQAKQNSTLDARPVPVPRVGRPAPQPVLSPVLKARYHSPNEQLPHQDAYYLFPFQRPPQQWSQPQKAKPNVHQIQMMRGRLGQSFDHTTYVEDRMRFEAWKNQPGLDPWGDKERAEKEKREREEARRQQEEAKRLEKEAVRLNEKRAERTEGADELKRQQAILKRERDAQRMEEVIRRAIENVANGQDINDQKELDDILREFSEVSNDQPINIDTSAPQHLIGYDGEDDNVNVKAEESVELPVEAQPSPHVLDNIDADSKEQHSPALEETDAHAPVIDATAPAPVLGEDTAPATDPMAAPAVKQRLSKEEFIEQRWKIMTAKAMKHAALVHEAAGGFEAYQEQQRNEKERQRKKNKAISPEEQLQNLLGSLIGPPGANTKNNPLAGLGLDTIGLSALEGLGEVANMNPLQKAQFEKEFKGMEPLLKGALGLWKEQMMRDIEAGKIGNDDQPVLLAPKDTHQDLAQGFLMPDGETKGKVKDRGEYLKDAAALMPDVSEIMKVYAEIAKSSSSMPPPTKEQEENILDAVKGLTDELANVLSDADKAKKKAMMN